jgi:hypothetical protein
MKTVVVYYSRYGNSRVAARLIAKQLGAPIHRIEVKRHRGVVPATPLKTFLAETRLAEKQVATFFSYTKTDPHKRPSRWMRKVLGHFGARLVAVGGYDISLKNHTVLKQRIWDFLAQLPPQAIPSAPSKKSARRSPQK